MKYHVVKCALTSAIQEEYGTYEKFDEVPGS